MLMTGLPPLNIIVISILVAAFGTLVEAASWRGFDNLFLPMGLLIFLSYHADDPLPDLLALAALFVACVVGFKLIAPRFGLTVHAARVYVTAVFLLFAVVEPQNAVFPILVLVAHVWARIAAPSGSKYPDLDVVSAVALVSFGSWVLGDAMGWNAVSFYGIATAAMMLGLCAIALVPQGWLVRLFGLVAIVLAACMIRAMVVALNPVDANWNGAMWPQMLAAMALTALVPSVMPQVFLQARMLRLTLLALIVPVGSYVYAMAGGLA
jgi:phytol kinase